MFLGINWLWEFKTKFRPTVSFFLILRKKSSPEDIFIDFRKRGREREREKHKCETSASICPDRGLNPQPFISTTGWYSKQLSHTGQDHFNYFKAYSSEILNILAMVYHHYSFLELFHHPKERPHAHKESHFPFPPFQPLVTTNLLSLLWICIFWTFRWNEVM